MLDHFRFIYLKYIIIAEIMFMIIIIALLVRHTAVHARQDQTAGQEVEYFTSVQVNAGESLWEISRRYYSSEYKSMDAYIRKIMDLNHMMNSDINAGAYLVIPYYETQPEPEL